MPDWVIKGMHELINCKNIVFFVIFKYFVVMFVKLKLKLKLYNFETKNVYDYTAKVKL